MLMTIYGRALAVLMKKPLKLWGLSLLSVCLTGVLSALCGFAIPGLALAVTLLLTTSMTMVYLAGYRGEEVRTVQLFSCFKDWQTIKRVTLGLSWMALWVFLWGLIPIVGPIFALIRAYQYRLTPYILITEPEVSITDAIKVSKERTNGYKLQMFLADFLIDIAYFVAVYILGILSGIDVIGILFALVVLALSICYAALRPLFGGLVQAAFYEEISNPTVPVAPSYQPTSYQQTPPAGGTVFCTKCGTAHPAGTKFCTSCGNNME